MLRVVGYALKSTFFAGVILVWLARSDAVQQVLWEKQTAGPRR